MMAIPELERHCGSWIATLPNGVVAEFFDRRNAEKADAAGWKVETAAQYLGRINAEWSSCTCAERDYGLCPRCQP
jgi:hypothetical protein